MVVADTADMDEVVDTEVDVADSLHQTLHLWVVADGRHESSFLLLLLIEALAALQRDTRIDYQGSHLHGVLGR